MDSTLGSVIQRISTQEYHLSKSRKAVCNKEGHFIYEQDGKLLPVCEPYQRDYKSDIVTLYSRVVSYCESAESNFIQESAIRHTPSYKRSGAHGCSDTVSDTRPGTTISTTRLERDFTKAHNHGVHGRQISGVSKIIFEFIEDNNWRAAGNLLDFAPDAELFQSDGTTHLIHMAAARIDPDAVTVLIKLAAERPNLLNQPDKNGDPPVLIALKHGHPVKTIKQLILGTDGSWKLADSYSQRLLKTATESGADDTAKWLSAQTHRKLTMYQDSNGTKKRPSCIGKESERKAPSSADSRATNRKLSETRDKRDNTTPITTTETDPQVKLLGRSELFARTVSHNIERLPRGADYRWWNLDFHKQLLKAARTMDLEQIKKLDQQRPVEANQEKLAQYDHYAVLAIMDDDKRLENALLQYPSDYRADLILWWNQANKRGEDQDYFSKYCLIESGKKLTNNSKLVLTGHGPKLGNIDADTMGLKLHQLLKGIADRNQTPRITLASCYCGEDDSEYRNYAKKLAQALVNRGRSEVEITCSSGLVMVTSLGEEICFTGIIKETDSKGFRKYDVQTWQGGDAWLIKEFALKFGLQNLTEDNRVTDLVKVVKTTSQGIVVLDKYDSTGCQGLHSIIFPHAY